MTGFVSYWKAKASAIVEESRNYVFSAGSQISGRSAAFNSGDRGVRLHSTQRVLTPSFAEPSGGQAGPLPGRQASQDGADLALSIMVIWEPAGSCGQMHPCQRNTFQTGVLDGGM